jgi:hypothetical protein
MRKCNVIYDHKESTAFLAFTNSGKPDNKYGKYGQKFNYAPGGEA